MHLKKIAFCKKKNPYAIREPDLTSESTQTGQKTGILRLLK